MFYFIDKLVVDFLRTQRLCLHFPTFFVLSMTFRIYRRQSTVLTKHKYTGSFSHVTLLRMCKTNSKILEIVKSGGNFNTGSQAVSYKKTHSASLHFATVS